MDFEAGSEAGSEVARHAIGPRVVALSITFPPRDGVVSAELAGLGRLLPAGSELLVGGQGAGSYRDAIEGAGSWLISGLGELRQRLAEPGGGHE